MSEQVSLSIDKEGIAMNFAEKLKSSGLSLAEFCRQTGTPRRTAEDWKYGKSKTPNIVFAWFELYTKTLA